MERFPVRINFGNGCYYLYNVKNDVLVQELFTPNNISITRWEILPQDARAVAEIMSDYLDQVTE